MNPKIKDYLGWVSLVGLVAAIVLGVQAVMAYSRSVPPAASFAVTGEGKVVAVPDTAELTFGVTTDGGMDVGSTQASNTQKMNSILDFIKSQGVDPKDVQTASYNISPRYQYYSCPPVPVGGAARPCPPSQVSGYTVSQTATAKVRDFGKIGDILAGLASRGATNVSGPDFTLHDETSAENQARADAITEAKSKAEAFAQAGGFHLGRILSIQESGSNPPVYAYKTLGMGGGTADSLPSPVISPGSQEIVKDITITYEIQ